VKRIPGELSGFTPDMEFVDEWLQSSLVEQNGVFEKARCMVVELIDIYNCSRETPWSGCRAQEYSNLDHYDGHLRDRAIRINRLAELLGLVERVRDYQWKT